MPENRFWNLLSKKLSGDATPDDLQELQLLLRQHPNFAYPAEQIESLWTLKPQPADAYDSELAFEQHLNFLKTSNIAIDELDSSADPLSVIEEKRSRNIRKPLFAFVAAACLAALAILFWPTAPAQKTPLVAHKSLSEISTKPGSKTRLVLPDSTVVWLNSGSKLTYNEQFGISNRNTVLTGEAFFDVKKSSIPFTIQANAVQIKVLGTVFNVKSYPNERTTETSLIHGRVEITLDKRPGEKFILKPNEKLIVSNDTPDRMPLQKKEPMVVLSSLTHSEQDESVIETSWVENKLIFHDESFEEVARKMERWYNVEIDIADAKLARMNVGGGPFESESIDQALTALGIAFNFKFTIKGNHITITR